MHFLNFRPFLKENQIQKNWDIRSDVGQSNVDQVQQVENLKLRSHSGQVCLGSIKVGFELTHVISAGLGPISELSCSLS